MRFTVDAAATNLVGLSEIVVNGPAGVMLPDTPPPTPKNLTVTEGVLYLDWEPIHDPGFAGYRLHYGTEPGHARWHDQARLNMSTELRDLTP